MDNYSYNSADEILRRTKMVADTELTNVFYDHWSHEDKQEYLDALNGAIAEIKELGPETYGKRTLAKLKEMRANCKDGILKDIEDDGVCPKCGAYMDYSPKHGEYVCPECGCKYSDSHDWYEDDDGNDKT